MLRHFRRRFRGMRGEPITSFTLLVTAVSPYPEEPEDEEHYRPSLLVAAQPEPGDPALSPHQLAIGSLLFAEWVHQQRGGDDLPVRLGAILPRLRPAVRHGQIGPHRYAAHRAGQRDNYFHHREAAAHTVSLHRDDGGLYVAVERRVTKGRWDEDSTLLEAALIAPYEALLRLEPAEGTILLDWLSLAAERWRDGLDADFPVESWPDDGPLAAP